jgi:putative membrane protein
MLRLVLAWLHLLALAVGPAAVWGRARALRTWLGDLTDHRALQRAFTADSWWGIAAVVWLATGLWRLLASTEKSASYYLTNHVFYGKMIMFVTVLAIEISPMITLIKWRTKKGQPNPRDAHRIEVASYVECAIVLVIVLFAVALARGFGSR